MFQRTVMPYSATPPNPAITRSSRFSNRVSTSRTGADEVEVERLDLQAVDGDDGVAVVHQMMRQGEPGRAEADDQHLAPAVGAGQRTADVQRIPARQQGIDLEAPGQRQHILQDGGLGLRNVDRLLLLVDAGLHAVVADAMAGRRHHRIVDGDRREGAQHMAGGAQRVHFAEIFSSSGQPARVTPNTDFWNCAGLAVLQAAASRNPCPGCGTRCSS